MACKLNGLCKYAISFALVVRRVKNVTKIASFYATYLRRRDKNEKMTSKSNFFHYAKTLRTLKRTLQTKREGNQPTFQKQHIDNITH